MRNGLAATNAPVSAPAGLETSSLPAAAATGIAAMPKRAESERNAISVVPKIRLQTQAMT